MIKETSHQFAIARWILLSCPLIAASPVIAFEQPSTEQTGDSVPSCCSPRSSRAHRLVPAELQVAARADSESAGVDAAAAGMVWIQGGAFVMGDDSPESLRNEKPTHRVRVDGFWMDATEVTNAEFGRFVESTGYLTTAEKAPTLDEIMAQAPPGTSPPPKEALVAASLVFSPPQHAVPLNNARTWWSWTQGANWRQPEGVGSSIRGKDHHPVVHVSWFDAVAY